MISKPIARHPWPRLLATAVALCLAVACRPSSQSPEAFALAPLPVPSGLAALDPPVRAQYEERRARLDQLLVEPGHGAQLAEAYGAVAMWHHAYGDFPLARLAYEHAVVQASTPRWLYYLGRVHGALGESDAARRRLTAFLEQRPDNVAARVHLAEIEMAAGRRVEAEALFSVALDLEPQTPRALAGIGRVALQDRDFHRAEQFLRRALDLQPDRSRVAYSLGLAYRGLGEADLAAEFMARGAVDNREKRDASMDDPLMQKVRNLERGSRVFGQKGRRAFVEGDFAQAIDAAHQAVRANPEALQPQLNLGAALLRADRPSEAVEVLEKVLRQSPGHPTAHFNLAATHYRLDQLRQAEANYRAAVVGNRRFKEAHFNLANLLRLRGEIEEALVHYETVIELDPGLALARVWRAACLVRSGHPMAARQALERDLEAQPGNPLLRLAYARLLATATAAEARDGATALRLAEALLQTRPQLATAEALAAAQAEQGRFPEAVAWQQKALDAAREQASGKALARLSRRLNLYLNGKVCRQFWDDDELKGATLPIIG